MTPNMEQHTCIEFQKLLEMCICNYYEFKKNSMELSKKKYFNFNNLTELEFLQYRVIQW